MTFLARAAIVALATYAVAAGAAAVVSLHRWRWRFGSAVSPQRPADLLRLRLMPAAIAAAVALLALIAFVRYEPRESGEVTGLSLLLLACTAAGLLIGSGVRVVTAWSRTTCFLRPLMRSALPVSLPGVSIPCYVVDAAVPVVAVVGVFRPKMVIAQMVLDRCSDEERAAVLQHERAHIRSGDNVRRLLLHAMPDFIAWSDVGRQWTEAWHDAAEEAADQVAVGDDPTVRVHLAAALVRLARLRPHAGASKLPNSSLFGGGRLERRVRLLLDPAPVHSSEALLPSTWLLILAVLTTLGLCSLGLIQRCLEAAVRWLP